MHKQSPELSCWIIMWPADGPKSKAMSSLCTNWKAWQTIGGNNYTNSFVKLYCKQCNSHNNSVILSEMCLLKYTYLVKYRLVSPLSNPRNNEGGKWTNWKCLNTEPFHQRRTELRGGWLTSVSPAKGMLSHTQTYAHKRKQRQQVLLLGL